MALLVRDTRQCVICSTNTVFTVVATVTKTEDIDLDGRDYKTSLLALPYWVQCCGGCEYCASDVRTAHENARAVCKTAAYLAIINDTGYPYITRHYRAAAYIAAIYYNHAEAGWHAIRAAWRCEDMSHPLASVCRQEAATHFINAYQQGQRFGQNNADECMIIADLHRRRGDMPQATHYNTLAAQAKSNERIQAAIALQQTLITQNITTRQVRPGA